MRLITPGLPAVGKLQTHWLGWSAARLHGIQSLENVLALECLWLLYVNNNNKYVVISRLVMAFAGPYPFQAAVLCFKSG